MANAIIKTNKLDVMTTVKKIIKNCLEKLGYDVETHPIARTPYDGPKVAFVHIAKCGGISVDTAIREAIACPNERRIDRDATLIASLASFGQPIKSIEDSVEFSSHHAHNLSNLFQQYLSKNWSYVSGHVSVTQHILNEYAKDYAFLTVLRDPVDRFISNYIFNKLTNAHPYMLPNTNKVKCLRAEAEQIIGSKRGWQMANTSTMFLTGRYPKNSDDAQIMQNEVRDNLSKFKIVGFIDKLPEFEQQCSKLTGREVNIGKRNTVNAINTAHSDCIKQELFDYFSQSDTQSKLHELCNAEIANYNFARTQFSSNTNISAC